MLPAAPAPQTAPRRHRQPGGKKHPIYIDLRPPLGTTAATSPEDYRAVLHAADLYKDGPIDAAVTKYTSQLEEARILLLGGVLGLTPASLPSATCCGGSKRKRNAPSGRPNKSTSPRPPVRKRSKHATTQSWRGRKQSKPGNTPSKSAPKPMPRVPRNRASASVRPPSAKTQSAPPSSRCCLPSSHFSSASAQTKRGKKPPPPALLRTKW